MHDLETLRRGGYDHDKITRLKLTESLQSFPEEIFNLGSTLTHLDLSGTGLSSLPSTFASSLPQLKIAFFSQCKFTTFPIELGACPMLEMVAFRGNAMTSVPEDSLPPRLRWLILTDNRIERLPASIGSCTRLQKCMLAGNRLSTLPVEVGQCRKLGLLRLSKNRFQELPAWLGTMPELAFLSFAGNPCAESGTGKGESLASVDWTSLDVRETLGEGASGIISKAIWRDDTDDVNGREVAVKIFKGNLTSDGTPEDEMMACMVAGQQENIIDILGRIHGHPEEAAGYFKGGLVMQLIPPEYRTLGQPPSFESCTRDNYPNELHFSARKVVRILHGIAAATAHLHSRGVTHGDLYAHNILTNDTGLALLGDLGAATVHKVEVPRWAMGLEALAFAHLIEDMIGLIKTEDGASSIADRLRQLHKRCSVPDVLARPSFRIVAKALVETETSS